MSEPQLLPAAVCAVLSCLALLLLQPAGLTGRASRAAVALGSLGAFRAGWLPQHSTGRVSTAPATRSPDAATLLELTAAMLRAGVGIEACLHRLSQDVAGTEPLARVYRSLTAGQGWEQAWASVAELPELRRFGRELAFAHATGAPTVELLELTAAQARRARRHELDEQAAKLGVRMVLPLGLCFLPAFILLGVIPVVLGMVQELA